MTSPVQLGAGWRSLWLLVLLACGAATAQPADKLLDRCLRDPERPRHECWGLAAARLHTTQDRLLTSLKEELRRCDVRWAGYDVPAALRELDSAQRSWQEFVRHECNYGDAVSGQGSGAAIESAVCDMKLTARRNEELRAKVNEARQVKVIVPDAVNCQKER